MQRWLTTVSAAPISTFPESTNRARNLRECSDIAFTVQTTARGDIIAAGFQIDFLWDSAWDTHCHEVHCSIDLDTEQGMWFATQLLKTIQSGQYRDSFVYSDNSYSIEGECNVDRDDVKSRVSVSAFSFIPNTKEVS